MIKRLVSLMATLNLWLDLKPLQFYNHFLSLDQVLEILWAR